MAKPKYHYNPKTLMYEKVKHSFSYYLKQVLFHLFSSISLGLLFFVAFIFLFDSPREKQLADQNRRLQSQYNLLNKKMDVMQEVLTDIQLRDNNMYRVIYQAEPIPEEVRNAEYVGDAQYKELQNSSNAELMVNTTKRLDRLAKQLYIQSLSLDEIVELAKQNKERLQCIPAIQPVLNKDLKRTASGYGVRIDPIYQTPKFHAGMDFSATTGSDIFVTGDGTVTFTGWKQGYGNTVVVSHGYGYETLYAHMSKITARRGAKVKRGETIGEVGNTGKSTGPHLHYEVRYRGNPQNPQNYYFMDLSPQEYDEMLQISANCGQVFD
ncbi:MAG: M23 family metallopeptidase [Paludibacteraceae bacterium]|nr:M23 family metallopeptidase [Paludibacteraceae bacterium]